MKLEKLGAKEKPCEREKTYWPHGKYWDQDVFELKQYLWKLEDNGMTFSKLWKKKKFSNQAFYTHKNYTSRIENSMKLCKVAKIFSPMHPFLESRWRLCFIGIRTV